ncbi:receptor-like protein 9a [Raphanus sativus]|uniref:Receptor-like protein 9a n=1 Tax=Raphanus sativus TaxID=3726 RepID=A0A6J0L1T5_RAPSA|nr:receptor-like protein 9a [Raphanus sativus]
MNNSILPFFSTATSLKTLILRYCNLEGRFPTKELNNLRNLEILDLSNNYLNGSLPEKEIANLHKLKALDLSDNKFSGSLDASGICELKNLHELDLSSNKLVGSILPCIGGLSKLLVLDLSKNQLNGSLPSVISNLKSLEYLSLYGNSFESLFSLSPLANLSKIKVFRLSSRSKLLQVEIRQDMWRPKFQLNVVELTYCNLGEIPSFLKYQRGLCKIDLSNNNLTGVFPTWILENNPELESLHIKNNALSMFQLPRLVHNVSVLSVGANHFIGPLPENIRHILPNLRMLNISSSGFKGNLPSSLGEMKRIKYMDMSYNNFSGNLPQNFTMGCLISIRRLM